MDDDLCDESLREASHGSDEEYLRREREENARRQRERAEGIPLLWAERLRRGPPVRKKSELTTTSTPSRVALPTARSH